MKNTSTKRSRYSCATKPSQLTDQAARDSKIMREKQFARSAASTTPASPTNFANAGSENSMLLTRQTNLSNHRRRSCPSKGINCVGSENESSTKITMMMGRGGMPSAEKMVSFLLETGQFDHLIVDYAKRIEARASEAEDTAPSSPPNVALDFYPDGKAVLEMHEKDNEKRKAAEQVQTIQEVANNPDSGVTVEEFSSVDDVLNV